MSDTYLAFQQVLEYLETHGWTLQRILADVRVFVAPEGEPDEPICVRVHGRKVKHADFKRIQVIVEEHQADQA